jgi:phosphatidylglycerophosphatase A
MSNGERTAIKESSDELNAPVVTTGGFIAQTKRQRTALDYVALALATCGVGNLPLAPGTWGSALGVGLYLLFRWSALRFLVSEMPNALTSQAFTSEFTSLLLALVVIVTAFGIWAATRAEKLLGRKDPGAVVIDEVAGQLTAFLFVPFNAGWITILVGFLAFRVFDIWKPYPIRHLEALESGLGIMGDDVLAGAYAAITLSVLTTALLLL